MIRNIKKHNKEMHVYSERLYFYIYPSETKFLFGSFENVF